MFALPDGSEAVSGGNLYNDAIIRELGKIAAVSAVSIDACRADVERGMPGIYFVDTLNLADALAFPARGPAQTFVLVVHHLPSLEPSPRVNAESLRVEERALLLFDAFLTTSPYTRDLLVERGFSPGAVLCVPPAPPAVAPPRRAYEPPLSALLVANLIERKGVLDFLQALASRVEANDRFSIDIVGRDDLDPDLARKCRDVARDSPALSERVRFAGAVPRAKVDDFYRSAHLFVSSAKMETFGMALQEARAWGLPILAFDGGHARTHFTDGDNGLLFSSIESLAASFLDLARDDDAMHRLFERSQALASKSNGTWELAAKRLLEQLGPWLGSVDSER